jgi:activator of Hsp90 ATPase-like protein
MPERSVVHATFTIERSYPVTPAKVFKAWADASAKRRWFACHEDWEPGAHELDFRVGGREHLRTGPPGGTAQAQGSGTLLVFTEQGAFLDGYDEVAGREEGTRIGLENLDRELRRDFI